MNGVAVGRVKENWNEDYQGMIKVEYVLGKAGKAETEWLPVMIGWGGESYGLYHLPEVGSKVVIGFENGNPNRGIVLGNIRSLADSLPEGAANEDNSKKMWKSKAGFTACVEEKEKKLTFTDPDHKNSVVWNMEEGCLTIDIKTKLVISLEGKEFLRLENQTVAINGDLEMTAKNMVVKPESLTLKSQKTIAVEPGQSMKIKAGQIQIEGTQIKVEGKQMQVAGTMIEVKGQGSVKIESGGIAEVKGSILKLN